MKGAFRARFRRTNPFSRIFLPLRATRPSLLVEQVEKVRRRLDLARSSRRDRACRNPRRRSLEPPSGLAEAGRPVQDDRHRLEGFTSVGVAARICPSLVTAERPQTGSRSRSLGGPASSDRRRRSQRTAARSPPGEELLPSARHLGGELRGRDAIPVRAVGERLDVERGDPTHPRSTRTTAPRARFGHRPPRTASRRAVPPWPAPTAAGSDVIPRRAVTTERIARSSVGGPARRGLVLRVVEN